MPIEFTPVECDPHLEKLGIHSDEYRYDFIKISRDMRRCLDSEDYEQYHQIIRSIAPHDLFFLCYFVLNLPVNHPFLVARIYEVQDSSDKTLDLWAREHWKSTILTFALPIQEIIKNPEERIVIFSHTKAIAKSHMRKIKNELESNHILHNAWPDIFYAKPTRDAPKWSEDEGIFVRRKGNFLEASFEAHGLIEKLPVGKHFSIRIYDDVITEQAVLTKHQLDKTERQFKLSEPLKTSKGRKRIIGTRYSHRDFYGKLIDSKTWNVRIFPAEVTDEGAGRLGGKPVYKTREELNEMYNIMGEYIYASQMLQNPTADGMRKFRKSWLRYQGKNKPDLNYYIIVDPASTLGVSADYTCMMVLGTDYLRNYWIVDIVRDRLELGEKWNKLRDLVLQYRPRTVGYEKNQAKGDIQYFDMQMEAEGVRFTIEPIHSSDSKEYRIVKLMPLFESGRIILPEALPYYDEKGECHDLVVDFIEEEYLLFPLSKHDDMLDVLSHVLTPEMRIFFPSRNDVKEVQQIPGFDPLDLNKDWDDGSDWMGQF